MLDIRVESALEISHREDSTLEVSYPGLEVVHQVQPSLTTKTFLGSTAATNVDSGKSIYSPVCGIPFRTFWIFFATVCLVVGAIVAGSVGGILTSEGRKATPPNPVVTVANASPSAAMHPYNPPSIRSIISVDTRCPNSTLDYEIGAPDLDKYKYYCEEDFDFNTHDLAWFTALSLEQYTAACGQYNARHSGETNQCVGIVLNGDVAETRKKDCGASCWLKNSTSTRSKKKGFTIVKAEVQS